MTDKEILDDLIAKRKALRLKLETTDDPTAKNNIYREISLIGDAIANHGWPFN